MLRDCAGTTRCGGPEPFKLRVVLQDAYLRVSLTDFFMSRVEAPVLSVPFHAHQVRCALCFALLCFALLCFALLCFALLCFALLCFALL